MSTITIADHALETFPHLRNEPVQARSAARLTALLDAAADVISEIGFERLTTAMVAERAGASIGTVYRYFPDRIAVLQALAARNLDRVVSRVVAEVGNPAHADWLTALSEGFAIFVEAFRAEPGFRSLRLGDVLDLGPAQHERSYNAIVADAIMDALVARFQVPDNERTRFLFEAAIEISDAMAARAFRRDPQGDDAWLEAGRDTVYLMLKDDFGPAATA